MPKITAAHAIRIATKTTPPMPAAASRSVPLSTKDATGPHRQGYEQHAERHRRRPRGTEEGGGQAFDDAKRDRRDHHAGETAEPAQHADGEDAADILPADRGLDRLDDHQRPSRPPPLGKRHAQDHSPSLSSIAP